ncbi:PqqD family peptide modification chaperone [Streptomyces sp. NPDC090445]|uniref:PqqD family peptide modification chaperone n=1 Tax=Streptomyces sp. NPDC090445 TaxID=3365963 RepID=UPI0038150637
MSVAAIKNNSGEALDPPEFQAFPGVAEAIRLADRMLVEDSRFGDTRAIEERNVARFSIGAELLAEQDPRHEAVLRRVSRAARDQLLPLLGDPVLRNAFEDDLVKLENGVRTGFGFGALASRIPAEPAGLGPCERMATPHVRPWPHHGSAWVWTEMSPADRVPGEMATRLRQLYDGSIEGGPSSDPVVPGPEMCQALGRGAELLTALLPQVGPSVLRHVSVVGFTRGESADGPLQSLSGGDPLPSAILMAPERLADPWTVAETLLHESVHLKLFDALRAGALLTEPEHAVPIPWRQTPWRLIRVLVALHFYVHLLVFQEAVRNAGPELRAEFGRPPAGEVVDEVTPGTQAAREGTFGSGLERVRYLAGYVRGLPPGTLTPAGRQFMRWLTDVTAVIDPEPDTATAPSGGPAGSGTAAARAGTSVPAATGEAVAGDAVAEESVAEESVAEEAVPRRTDGTLARPIPAHGELLLADAGTCTLHWLNARSWLVYSLCDGRDVASVRAEYARRSGADEPTAAAQVAACLAELRNSGLLS